MKIAIMTDTNSGISTGQAQELGIFLLPMPIIIDEQVYFEGKNLTNKEFYSALTGGRNISTSQPSPGDLIEAWENILEMGYDEIVHIPMSSGLSASCESAALLAKDFDGRVLVVDNHRISVTLQEAVKVAKKMVDDGYSAVEIKNHLEKTAPDSIIYISVDTLEFLKKGGRITAATAAIGSVLNIKPVLVINGEKLDAFSKVRGIKKAKLTMIEALKNDLSKLPADTDLKKLRIGTAGAGLSDTEIDEWVQQVQEAFPEYEVCYSPLSASVACHTGPGAVGIAYSID